MFQASLNGSIPITNYSSNFSASTIMPLNQNVTSDPCTDVNDGIPDSYFSVGALMAGIVMARFGKNSLLTSNKNMIHILDRMFFHKYVLKMFLSLK